MAALLQVDDDLSLSSTIANLTFSCKTSILDLSDATLSDGVMASLKEDNGKFLPSSSNNFNHALKNIVPNPEKIKADCDILTSLLQVDNRMLLSSNTGMLYPLTAKIPTLSLQGKNIVYQVCKRMATFLPLFNR
jgi:hypothetical protein